MSSHIQINFREISTNSSESHTFIGRQIAKKQVSQIITRPGRHVLVRGKPGVGKTSFIHSCLRESYNQLPVYELRPESILPALVSGERLLPIIGALQATGRRLTPARLVIEDVHLLGLDDPLRLDIVTQLIQPFLDIEGISLVLSLESTATTRQLEHNPFFGRHFDLLDLNEPSEEEAAKVVGGYLDRTGVAARFDPVALRESVRLARRYGSQALPGSAIRLVDQALARLPGSSTVDQSDLRQIIADQTGIPLATLKDNENQSLGQLAEQLSQRVIGQRIVLEKIAATVQRARLGLADPRRPRASFLLLGPSGVGKTETAKVLSELVFGSTGATVRLDMTEFGESHMAARLTGAPPGYAGYETGGQLTNPIVRQPYSLILLDELEKAHRRVHDLFLQVLDDGRLTDAAGQVVDFSQTVILATTNIASREIIDALAAGRDIQQADFLDEIVMPTLLRVFRPEFLNRFDAILVYQPLSETDLLQIAELGVGQLEQRLADRRILVRIPVDRLRKWLAPFRNPLLGARPVRRMIQERLEVPLARHLLHHPDAADLVVTGEEAWLA